LSLGYLQRLNLDEQWQDHVGQSRLRGEVNRFATIHDLEGNELVEQSTFRPFGEFPKGGNDAAGADS
jgi:hypothetical protein